MRLTFTLVLLFSFSSFSYAQKLTGIWRGYFMQQDRFNPSTGKFDEERYKYEVQINQLKDNNLEGVTYSYKSIVFYGKASLHGRFTPSTKNVLLKETKMLDLKISDHSVACLMTCYLDYSKSGKLETLSGTYTSQNQDDKTDCGSGTIYLEKVKTSDFEKEPFLLKNSPKKNQTNSVKKDSVINKKTDQHLIPKKSTVIPPKKNNVAKAPVVKKSDNKNNITKKPGLQKDSTHPEKIISSFTDTGRRKENTISKNISPLVKAFPIPRVLKERANSLIKTLEIDEKDVQIDYYDNGEIDNDTITVYHNNELVVDKGRLSYSPITIHIHLDETNPIHEIITVADNLGDVPPNTALMVITTPGRKRYEIFITSDEKTNAKVILEYKPKKPVKLY
ncbi:MAG: hypothetical protein KGL19_06590 [Bacteroidota bacterium]|nr:hypothetical protein [Bacteroidota bacterium]